MMPVEWDGDRLRSRARRKMCMWAIVSLFMVLIALSAVGHRKAIGGSGRHDCPRHWAGASDKFVGSCWCGWDKYCMCTPSLAIDTVVEIEDPNTKEVESVLVVRRKDNGKLACIGGFVEVGETLPEAVRREVWEETGLEVTSWRMIPRVYDDPDRDARRHTVSVAYVVRTNGVPTPGGEEESVEWIPVESLRDRLHEFAFDHSLVSREVEYLKGRLHEFAFDHSLILTDYLAGIALASPLETLVVGPSAEIQHPDGHHGWKR